MSANEFQISSRSMKTLIDSTGSTTEKHITSYMLHNTLVSIKFGEMAPR